MSIKRILAAGAAFVCLSMIGTMALADDHAFTEGTVSQV